jgi:hypothetical protein
MGVHKGVKVKLARGSATGDTVVLYRSADRRRKERAMHDKFSRRIELALEQLGLFLGRNLHQKLRAPSASRYV